MCHKLHIGRLADVGTVIGCRAAYNIAFAVYGSVGRPHDNFGFAVFVPVEGSDIGFNVSAAQQVGADINSPKQGSVQFIGFEIAEGTVVGYRKVVVDAFYNNFVLSVAVEIGSRGIVQLVEWAVVDAVFDDLAHGDFQVLFVPDRVIARFRAFNTFFDQSEGISRSIAASLVQVVRNTQRFCVQFDPIAI